MPYYHEVTDEERAAGSLSPSALAGVRGALHADGYAVVGGLVSAETCALLAEAVHEDVARVRSSIQKPTPHELQTGLGHMQLGLRRHAPYVRADLVANDLIESVVAAVLGKGAWLGFYNGNVNCPGSGAQPLHFDRPFSWTTPEAASAAGQPWPPPTTTLSCSVALTPITPECGPTEIYPGSHLHTGVTRMKTNRLSQKSEMVAAQAAARGVASMTIPAGGVCFRDPRMWHRGVSNRSDRPRPMIALTYHSRLALHWRGKLTTKLTPTEAKRCETDPTLRLLDGVGGQDGAGGLGDGRLVFHASAAPAFALRGAGHGVLRNVRFVTDPLVVNHFLDAHLVGGARVQNSPAGVISPDRRVRAAM